MQAQQYYFKNYNPESGLLSVQISCLFQDSQGYLWAGGFGGLTRFDGKNFVNYSPKNGLIEHNVTSIAEDRNGNILVGTTKGLSVIKNNKITNYSSSMYFNKKGITSICKNEKDKIYIGTGEGLFEFLDGHLMEVKAISKVTINCLYQMDRKILIGTNSGLIIFENDQVTKVDTGNGLSDNIINSIATKRNEVYLGTSKGLNVLNTASGQIKRYQIENGLIDENITALMNQHDAYIWIASNSGLLRFDGNQFTFYNVGLDNNSNVVKCLLNDREDNVWMGTHSGIYKYRDNSFSSFDKVNGPGNAFIFQIFRDKNENLWLCSDNTGLYRYSQGFFKRYAEKEGLGTNVVHAGLEDDEGRLLFGTKNGVLQFKNERFTNIPLPKEFKGPYEMLLKRKDGTVWIAGGNGVAQLTWKNNAPVVNYYSLPVDIPYQAYCLWEDDERQLWIGTSPAGLFKMKGDSFVNVSKELNLLEENYYAIRAYKEYLFVATLNGLYVVNSKTGENSYITEQDGLNSELVYSVEFAENKKVLWIGTNQGINKLDLDAYFNEGKKNIISYSKQHGFTGVECNSNGIWEDKDGSLWFGTVSGLVKHEPSKLKPNLIPNITVIQNIKLFSEDTLLNSGVELASNFNTITFYYKGICLTNPEQVKYIKKLEGLEKEWSLPSSEDYCKYANIGPGTYTFMVKSQNNEGVWDPEPTMFVFTVLRPFYTTWWFNLLLIATIISLTYIAFMIRVRSIQRKQKVEYERRVEMSKIELKALRAQMNPHFIFNSLNSIQHYIFNAKSDEAIKYLSKFARLVRTILNNSNKPTVTVGEDLEALRLYLELEQMRFEGKFDYEIKVDESVDPDYDIMPPLLIQPYVENSILHGLNPKPGKGKLSVSFTSKDNFLICTITDDGIGREKASEIKRTMPISKHKSMGMKITEDRLKILNEVNNSQLNVSIIDLKNPDGSAAGTEVKLYIPILG